MWKNPRHEEVIDLAQRLIAAREEVFRLEREWEITFGRCPRCGAKGHNPCHSVVYPQFTLTRMHYSRKVQA